MSELCVVGVIVYVYCVDFVDVVVCIVLVV